MAKKPKKPAPEPEKPEPGQEVGTTEVTRDREPR